MSEKIKALVVTQDGGKIEQLRTAFEALPGFEVKAETAEFGDCLSRAGQFAPDAAVVFLDEQPGSAGCLILEQLKKTRENLFVFAVSSERSAELIVKAIRAGADELISTMPNTEELLKAFVRIAERRKQSDGAPSETRRVVTVYSPHGGSGVTTLSVNLAVALRRLSGEEVVLVDLDLQCGETPVFLDFKPLYTILDVCQGIGNLDQAYMAGALYAHPSGVRVLAPPAHLEEGEAVTAADFEKILATLRSMYSFVVIDGGTHLSETTLVAIEKADDVFLMTDNMVASVRAVQRCLDTLTRLGLETDDFQIVLNRPIARSEISTSDIKDALKLEIAHKLPIDEATAIVAANHGKPLDKVNPRSPLVEAIEGIAKSIAGEATRAQQGRGLFGRFFSEART